MPNLDLDIVPLSPANPYCDLFGCAKLINRRRLFEPNRLRDEARPEDVRIAAHAESIRQYVNRPDSTSFFAREKQSGEIVGWIGWLRPNQNAHVTALKNSSKDSIDTVTDTEKDVRVIEQVMSEKKALEKKCFQNEPFWTLSYLFVSSQHRRAKIGTRLVEHFLAVLREEDPNAKVGFTSSPSARYLYEKQGFRVAAWMDYTFQDIDETGRTYLHRSRWPYMTNYYRHSKQEVERISVREAFDGPADEDPEVKSMI